MRKQNSYTGITDIMRELYRVSGFRISIHDVNFAEIAAYPPALSPFCSAVQRNSKARAACIAADEGASRKAEESGETCIYKCPFGLCEAVAPLYSYGELSGYLMMGQILSSSPSAAADAIRAASPYFDDKTELEALASSIKTLPPSEIEAYISIMRICAEHITMSGGMHRAGADVAADAMAYMSSHYASDITLASICTHIGCSKTKLMQDFRREYGMTVMQMLTSIRVGKAEKLLKNTDESIGFISDACGFSDQNYFAKVFFRINHLTPSAYRKKNRVKKL